MQKDTEKVLEMSRGLQTAYLIALRLEAITLRLEAIALRVEAIARRVEAIAIREGRS